MKLNFTLERSKRNECLLWFVHWERTLAVSSARSIRSSHTHVRLQCERRNVKMIVLNRPHFMLRHFYPQYSPCSTVCRRLVNTHLFIAVNEFYIALENRPFDCINFSENGEKCSAGAARLR